MTPEPHFGLTFDREVELRPGEFARTFSNVPFTLEVFDTHFPRFPVVPGVLIMDALAGLASMLLSAAGGRLWRLKGVEQVRFRHYVRPGDQVELSVRLLNTQGADAELEATAAVAGRTATQIRRLRMTAEP